MALVLDGEQTLLRFDLTAPAAPVRRHRLPAPARALVAAQGRTVEVVLDDSTLRRVEFADEGVDLGFAERVVAAPGDPCSPAGREVAVHVEALRRRGQRPNARPSSSASRWSAPGS